MSSSLLRSPRHLPRAIRHHPSILFRAASSSSPLGGKLNGGQDVRRHHGGHVDHKSLTGLPRCHGGFGRRALPLPPCQTAETGRSLSATGPSLPAPVASPMLSPNRVCPSPVLIDLWRPNDGGRRRRRRRATADGVGAAACSVGPTPKRRCGDEATESADRLFPRPRRHSAHKQLQPHMRLPPQLMRPRLRRRLHPRWRQPWRSRTWRPRPWRQKRRRQ